MLAATAGRWVGSDLIAVDANSTNWLSQDLPIPAWMKLCADDGWQRRRGAPKARLPDTGHGPLHKPSQAIPGLLPVNLVSSCCMIGLHMGIPPIPVHINVKFLLEYQPVGD